MADLLIKILEKLWSVSLIIFAALGLYKFGKNNGKEEAKNDQAKEVTKQTLESLRIKKNEIKNIGLADDYIKRMHD